MRHHSLTLGMHHRLEVQPQLTLFECPVKRGQTLHLEGGPLILLPLKGRVASTRPLDPVHGGVRMAQQGVQFPCVVRVHAQPQTPVDEHLLTGGHERHRETVFQALRHQGDVRDRTNIGEQQHELVSAHPGHHVAGCRGFFQAARDVFEEVVTLSMTEGVVDQLKAVEIQEPHHHFLPGMVGAPAGFGELLAELNAVGKTCERVVHRHMAELEESLAQLQLGHRHLCEGRKELLFFLAKFPRFRSDDAEGAELLAVRRDERGTRVRPDVWLAEHVGIGAKLLVLGGVRDNHHAVLSDGDRAERLAAGPLGHREAMVGLEPLPVLVNESDLGHGHVEDADGQLHEVVELRFWGRVEDGEAVEGGQSQLLSSGQDDLR